MKIKTQTFSSYGRLTHQLSIKIYWKRVKGVLIKPASHCPIVIESGGTQSIVQSDEIRSNCFGPILHPIFHRSQFSLIPV